MNSGVFKRAIGLVLIYIGVLLALVLLQFSRPSGFLAKSGRLEVTASWASAERKGPPSSVRIDYAGLIFELSSASPAILTGTDGSTTTALPESVEKIPGGARIRFIGGGELDAMAVPAAGSASAPAFKLTVPQIRPDMASLSISYRLSGRNSMGAEASPLLYAGGGPYALDFSASALDPKTGRATFDLSAGNAGLALRSIAPVARIAPVVAAKPQALGKNLPAALDPAVYKADVDAWDAKVWTGLATSRWDADKLAWKDASGTTSSFSERALMAYLAEAASRGGYSDALSRMKQAVKRSSSSVSYLSSPFLGSTVRLMEERETTDPAEVKRISTLIQANDPSILEKEGLLHFLMDRCSPALAQSGLHVIASLDPAKLSVRSAIGYLACAVEASGYLTDAENPFSAGDAAADRLVSAAAKTPEGFFLKSEDDGSSDLRESLIAGRGLIAWGGKSGKDGLVGLGQSLVVSALGLADANGFLPAKLTPKADSSAASDRSGSLAPEDFYALALSNPFYPREVSFYRELGPGVWAWTCAPSISVANASGSSVLSVDFTVGLAHYMAIYGLKPFSSIKLYGINYSPDSAFESYDVSGYLYRGASNALYLKMKHKQGTEKIELYY
jgi:hypothetical protein